MTARWSMRFDRRISDELVDALRPDGWLHSLLIRRNANPTVLDLQGRRATSGRACRVSLYAGLSRILDVHERGGKFRLASHPSYQRIGDYNPSWSHWQRAADLGRQWPDVERYIDAVLGDTEVLPRYLRREGQVHPLLCAGLATGYRVVQREAIVAFPNTPAKQAAIESVATRIYQAVGDAGRSEPWWPGVRDRGKWPPLGSEVDLLGIDDAGRLLVIEAKPADEIKGIAWAPAQVGLYAQLFAKLLTVEGGAADLLDEMLAQRVELGLTRPGGAFSRPVRVVPVVAIGPGPMSPAALERLGAVSEAIGDILDDPVVDPLEVWILDGRGAIDRHWQPSEQPVPGEPSAVVAGRGTFVSAGLAARSA